MIVNLEHQRMVIVKRLTVSLEEGGKQPQRGHVPCLQNPHVFGCVEQLAKGITEGCVVSFGRVLNLDLKPLNLFKGDPFA